MFNKTRGFSSRINADFHWRSWISITRQWVSRSKNQLQHTHYIVIALEQKNKQTNWKNNYSNSLFNAQRPRAFSHFILSLYISAMMPKWVVSMRDDYYCIFIHSTHLCLCFYRANSESNYLVAFTDVLVIIMYISRYFVSSQRAFAISIEDTSRRYSVKEVGKKKVFRI